MGWDQSIGRESVRDFLLGLMGIDPDQILREALQAKMAEAGLTYGASSAVNGNGEPRELGDGMYNVFTADVITLSDGRVFVEALTESTQGADWGNDFYSFVEVGKPFKYTRNDYCGCENDPHVSTDEQISTYMLPDPKTPTLHHPECNDLTRCHPDCAFAQERASEDPVASSAHNVLRPEVVFGEEGKKFTPDEIREQSGEFGDSIADFMEEQNIDHISFEPGDDDDE